MARIAYLAGPADALQIYHEWSGNQQQQYVGTNYFKQFLQLAEDLDADCYVITWHGEQSLKTKIARFTFDNRPLTKARGARYFLEQAWWHIKLLPDLVRFKPDLFVLTGNQNFWWLLSPVRGVRLPSFHSVLWPKFAALNRIWKILTGLDARIVLRRCKVVVATSGDIARQVNQVSNAEVICHLPTYSPQQFAGISPAHWSHPFRVIFVSRIEASKGTFDVLEMARQLPHIEFEVCGDGTALARARTEAPGNVRFHGFCGQEKLREIMSQCHVAVVPTRSTLEAGFEMTCAEAILAGRPLITSAVCPALEYLGPAAIEVQPDNVEEYISAISMLSSDQDLYERKRAASFPLQSQFYDERNSWIVAMKKAVKKLEEQH